MAAAVREMLQAANIPCDMETTRLLQQTLSLQEKLDTVTNSLDLAEQVDWAFPDDLQSKVRSYAVYRLLEDEHW